MQPGALLLLFHVFFFVLPPSLRTLPQTLGDPLALSSPSVSALLSYSPSSSSSAGSAWLTTDPISTPDVLISLAVFHAQLNSSWMDGAFVSSPFLSTAGSFSYFALFAFVPFFFVPFALVRGQTGRAQVESKLAGVTVSGGD